MGKKGKWAIGVIAIAGIGSTLAMSAAKRGNKATEVRIEAVQKRDLVASVTASGQVRPQTKVDVAADVSGRIDKLAVKEGEMVRSGQFLLQIDPKTLRSRVDSGSASLQANILTLEQMKQAIETARAQLVQAQQTLTRQQDLWKQQLTTREALEKAENDVKVAQSNLQEREKMLKPQESRIAQERAGLDSAQYDLSKVRIVSPIDGIVTARTIQEGEMVMIGTMNNAGTVLMTLADMSVIQAEVEVDETNVPNVQLGQKAKITIDALPDRSFRGHVAEIGNSPIQAAAGATGTQATNFKVKVMVDEPIPEVRPGFTCTADITTATRKEVVSVPIPAVAVRELIYDASGQIVKEPKTDKKRRGVDAAATTSSTELKPGQTRKETEGVFAVRDNKAEFVPIKMGIAGDKYFEVLSGLKSGDQVITGPYNSVRGMSDGDLIKVDNNKKK